MTQFLLAFTILLFTLFAQAEIKFHQVKSEEWKQEVTEIVEKVENLLPESWPEIGLVNIVYIESSDPAYRPLYRYTTPEGDLEIIEKLLVLNDSDPRVIAHEYAHFLLDDYMRQTSKAWKHYFIWAEVAKNDISESLEDYKKTIESLKSTLAEFEADPNNKLDLTRIKNSIKKYEILIEKLKVAKAIEEEYSFSLYDLDSFNALSAYYELHADTLAVLALENWDAMREVTISQLSDPENYIQLPDAGSKEESTEALLNSRSFLKNVDIENYNYQEWEAKHIYTQFTPARSFMRNYVENKTVNSQELVGKLSNAILEVYEEVLLPNPENTKRNLKVKNQELINFIENL